MRTILGVFLLSVAVLGTIYFRNYTGSIIAYPYLWYLLFILLGIFGIWLVYSALKSKMTQAYQRNNEAIEMMKRTAAIIELDFDKCEFKNGSYSQEVEVSSTSAIDLLTNSSPGAGKMTTEHITRYYIVYTDDVNGESGRFISQAFPLDLTMLKLQVMNRKLSLYVDRFDKNKYFFEMKE
jgi:hypothetical protein